MHMILPGCSHDSFAKYKINNCGVFATLQDVAPGELALPELHPPEAFSRHAHRGAPISGERLHTPGALSGCEELGSFRPTTLM